MANPTPVSYSSPVGKVGGGRERFPNASLDLLASIPDGQWVKASLNAYSSVWPPSDLRPVYGGGKHNPNRIIKAWSGFAWDRNRSRLYIWGGGHANTSGNEVYIWDAKTRLWSLGCYPSDVLAVTGGETGHDTVDGWRYSPISSHTYSGNSYLPIIDRLVSFGGAAHSSGGGYVKREPPGSTPSVGGVGHYRGQPALLGKGFVGGLPGSNPATGAYAGTVLPGARMWEPSDYVARGNSNVSGISSMINGGVVVVEEEGCDVLYVMSRNGTQKQLARLKVVGADFINDTAALVGSYSSNASSTLGPVAFDSQRKVFINIAEANEGPTSHPITFWDLKPGRVTGAAQAVNPAGFTGPGADFFLNTACAVSTAGFGAAYDPVRNRFVVWTHGYYGSDASYGSTIVGITPPDGTATPTTGWYVEVLRAHDSGGAQPETDAEMVALGREIRGVCGKFRYAEGMDCFVGLNDVDNGNVWFWKPHGWQDPRVG